MMASLRLKSIERLSAQQPGELGILLGLDRVPEVKTLRGKLAQLGGQHQGAKLAAALTKQWVQGGPRCAGHPVHRRACECLYRA